MPHLTTLKFVGPFALALLLATSLCLPAHGQNTSDESAKETLGELGRSTPLSTINHYLTPHTLGGARLRLELLDTAALFQWAAQNQLTTNSLNDPITQIRPLVQATINGIRNQGCEDVWILVDSFHLNQQPPIILTVAPGDEAADKLKQLRATVESLLPDTDEIVVVTAADHLLIGPPGFTEFIKEQHELSAARSLPAGLLQDNAAVAAFFLPSPDQRRVLIESLGNAPAPFTHVDLGQLATDINSVAVSLALKPDVSLSVQVATPDNQAAQRLTQTLQEMAEQGSKFPGLAEQIPELVKFLDDFSLTISDSSVNWTASQENGMLENVIRLVSIPMGQARRNATRQTTANQMKQIMLAFHNYFDTHKEMPQRASLDDEGKPLLSWRVHLLPFLDQKALYDQFHLDEPWDSEHNLKLAQTVVPVFTTPNSDIPAGKANYLVIQADNMFLAEDVGRQFKDITDGTSNTIAIVEVDAEHAVPWTKPDDLKFDPKNPTAGLKVWDEKVIMAGFIDGSVRTLPLTITEEVWNHLFQINDGQPIDQQSIR